MRKGDSRLTARLGSLSPATMEQIEAVLAFTLDMFAR
jgi:mRNA-degrading endonuclease toxin of MazEF toxin-antitoxin module